MTARAGRRSARAIVSAARKAKPAAAISDNPLPTKYQIVPSVKMASVAAAAPTAQRKPATR